MGSVAFPPWENGTPLLPFLGEEQQLGNHVAYNHDMCQAAAPAGWTHGCGW